ncbi:MAG: AAA family ATPase [Actinobacteria bacterium]|uniref:shikimate kinase n=1 Tax=freshwater metagenome TaxID=449393 RepID=A0A6J7CNM5_9ZZZZ|nr:shikimate kinase [Actinomycetota bacterium]MSW46808.1 AAA family ATPase [Actinomycetota bacterium]MSX24510.1 AAA family ATPase [Actinomycetota bacterium]MSY46668.1 AAA family ATPase [Actinomycetota bacterium]MTB00194.1 AAA family ATPase [Actinomycetota bacterium]
MTHRIILIGPPGAGKSSVGRSLAKKLEVDFADTDHLIVRDQGKSISEIFVDDGEEVFRKIEERICLDSITTFSGVLSLGGGAVLSANVQKSIAGSGAMVFFLDVPLAVAAPRIGFNRDRPLLLGNPRQQWSALMEIRRPIYETLATSIVNVGDDSVAKVVQTLLAKVNS